MTNHDLERMVTGVEPAEFRSYLARPVEQQLFAAGSTVPVIGARRAVRHSSGLLLPDETSLGGPIEYTGAYITLTDYCPLEDLGSPSLEFVKHLLADGHDRAALIEALGILNHVVGDHKRLSEYMQEFRNALGGDRQERFDALISQDREGMGRVLATRQTVLAAMRWLLTAERSERPASELPPMLSAILLTHAVAVDLNADDDDIGLKIGGYPAHLAMEVLRVGLLGEHDDIYATIDRVIGLWREYGSRTSLTRAAPADLLREATGLEIEDFLALGFAFLSIPMGWAPGKEFVITKDLGIEMDRATVEKFLGIVTTTPDNLAAALKKAHPRFGFLAMEKTPVLELPHGYLVLDERFLWQRVTTGLYWLVHDHEKSRSEQNRLRWTQAYAEMVEMLVEDQLRATAPPILGGGTTFYTEDEIGQAYGAKRCDTAIDFGGTFVLVEIVSGFLTVPTRIEGSVESFAADTERLVIKKCRQLHEAATAILNDPAVLTGGPSPDRVRIVPVVVVGGGYPVNPLSLGFVRTCLEADQLLDDSRIESLCVIDLGELEIMEGLAEKGHSPAEVLTAWKNSNLRDVWLRNYLLKVYDLTGPESRPGRMKARVDETFQGLVKRLRFRKPATEREPGGGVTEKALSAQGGT